jgi:adenylate cyclase
VSIEGFKRKLTAILSADVKGYSRLMGEDDAATVRTITDYREVITAMVQHHRGRVVDSPGDNILAEFPSVVDAVGCAVEVQKALKARNEELPEDRRMEFRIGINLGDVIEEEGRLYGDGVNIAARIEALAEPGGICISGTVYEHIQNKLTLWNEYLGEHRVKNITQPIKVYRVHTEPVEDAETSRKPRLQLSRRHWVALGVMAVLVVIVGAYLVWSFELCCAPPLPEEALSPPTPTLELSEKPSIAVLPFDNMSGDSEQEYFSDGLTEDLITDLSKVSGLFVIARNSAFVYKGQAVNIQEVGRELGVLFILEGSVRKSNGTVRITAQLIDATSGGHLWAEKYDRDLEDIFAVQDEVVGKIVDALAVTLTEDEQERLAQMETDNLEAYDFAQRGWWYYQQYTQEANDQARLMFERAIEIDPRYAEAYAGIGFTYYEAWAQQWSQDPQSLDRAYELAVESIALDDSRSGAYALLSHVYLWRKQYEQAITELERAIALEPNKASNYRDLAETLIFAGRPEEAVEHIQEAIRLNPHYPANYPFTLGFAHTTMSLVTPSQEHYQDAIEAFNEAISLNPNFYFSHVLLAYVYSQTGQGEEARNHVAQALEINPQLSLDALRERTPVPDPVILETFLDALHEAGLD